MPIVSWKCQTTSLSGWSTISLPPSSRTICGVPVPIVSAISIVSTGNSRTRPTSAETSPAPTRPVNGSPKAPLIAATVPTPAARASSSAGATSASVSSIVMPMLWCVISSLTPIANATRPIRSWPSARRTPRALGVNAVNVAVPRNGSSSSQSASASSCWGSRRGFTNEVNSMSRTPASTSARTKRARSATWRLNGRLWNPSRGETSWMRIGSGIGRRRSRPVGLATVEECADRLTRSRARAGQGRDLACVAEGPLEREVLADEPELLDQFQRTQVPVCQRGGELIADAIQVGGRNDLADQAPSRRLRGGNPLAGEDPIHADPPGHAAQQDLHDHRGRHREFDLRIAQDHLLRTDHEVTGGCDSGAAGESRALDAGDRRLWELHERGEELPCAAMVLALEHAVAAGCDDVELRAGTERLSLRPQEDDVHAVVLASGPERRRQPGD